MEWSDTAIEGSYKFLKRLWTLSYNVLNKKSTKERYVKKDNRKIITDNQVNMKINKTIEKVTNDIFQRNSFNTAVASIMELLNHLIKYDQESHAKNDILINGIKAILKMLSPFTPHITQKIWSEIGETTILMHDSWPEVDHQALEELKKEIIIQINGKLRGKVIININQDENEIKKLVMKNDKISSYLRDVNVKKIIQTSPPPF